MDALRLIIAEKPNLGRGIADVLGGGTNRGGYIELDDRSVADAVTWLFGHMYHLRMQASEYDPRFKEWRAEDLPLDIPELEYVLSSDKKEQIGIIHGLLKRTALVIHAGDPDREGQLLVDNVLRFANYQGKVLRLVARDMSGKGLRDAFDHLEPAEKWTPYRYAAELRGEADWRVGVNVSRALTCAARAVHARGKFNMGRVQTPTLAMLVRREDTIANFIPKNYFSPRLFIHHTRGDMEMGIKLPKDFSLFDEEGYLTDKNALQEFLEEVLKQPKGTIRKAEKKREETPPPLCYSLTTLPSPFTAQKTLEIMQSLYEKGLTTYPRTECRYMPKVQHANAREILPALSAMGIDGAGKADPSLMSRLWNDAEAEAQPHHAIVPTGQSGEMTTDERRLFEIVAGAYVRNFYPSKISEKRIVEAAFSHPGLKKWGVEETIWDISGSIVLERGWTVLDTDSSPACPVPDGIVSGDGVEAIRFRLADGKTSPPSHYTEASLLLAMSEVSRQVTDKDLRDILREVKGIGTSATRPGIIESLKRNGYVVNQTNPKKKRGKNGGEETWIIPTEEGKKFIHALPDIFTSPEETAIWESMLTDIAEGKLSPDVFKAYMQEKLPLMVKKGLETKFMPGETYPCPDCGAEIHQHTSRDGNTFWSCDNRCGFFTEDVDGKPEIFDVRCSLCGKMPRRHASKKTPGKTYVACMNCEAHEDNGNKPVFFHEEKDGSWKQDSGEKQQAEEVDAVCPECGEKARRFLGKDGAPYVACMNRQAHKDGKPVYFEERNGTWQPRQKPKETGQVCPHCGAACREYMSKKTGKPYVACMESGKHPDGKPYFPPK